MTDLYFLAILQNASVVGPAIFSASLKCSWSSTWQKYCERKSSCVQMICAPCFAAFSTSVSCFLRFAFGSTEQLVWIRPSFTMELLRLDMVGEESPRRAQTLGLM